MKFCAYALLTVAVLGTQPAAAINKCTGSDGKVTFQDAQCASGRAEMLDVKPSSGNAPGLPAAKAGASASVGPVSEAARLEGIISVSQRTRRARDLRERLLPEAERAVKEHRDQCSEKQKVLASQQYVYQQNLYGKTHAAQIASEMAATAATCETKDRELKEVVDALTKECSSLTCRG
jgi:hypothetical protein